MFLPCIFEGFHPIYLKADMCQSHKEQKKFWNTFYEIKCYVINFDYFRSSDTFWNRRLWDIDYMCRPQEANLALNPITYMYMFVYTVTPPFNTHTHTQKGPVLGGTFALRTIQSVNAAAVCTIFIYCSNSLVILFVNTQIYLCLDNITRTCNCCRQSWFEVWISYKIYIVLWFFHCNSDYML